MVSTELQETKSERNAVSFHTVPRSRRPVAQSSFTQLVGFHDRRGDLRRRIDRERQLGFLAVVHGETFQQEGSQAGTRSASGGKEDGESLEGLTSVRDATDAIHGQVDHFLADRVMSPREATGTDGARASSVDRFAGCAIADILRGQRDALVGRIFLSGDELFGMVQPAVFSAPDLVDHRWLKIQVQGPWHILSRGGLGEEGAEGFFRGIGRCEAILVDPVFQAEKLPAGAVPYETRTVFRWSGDASSARVRTVSLRSTRFFLRAHPSRFQIGEAGDPRRPNDPPPPKRKEKEDSEQKCSDGLTFRSGLLPVRCARTRSLS